MTLDECAVLDVQTGDTVRIARAGLPFLMVPAVLAAVAAILGWWPLVIALSAVAGYMAFFFRDPERAVPESEGLVLAPGDGRVMAVSADPPGPVGLNIFLGLLDVHVNRAPASGTVVSVDKQSGLYKAAFKAEAGEVNVQNRIVFDTPAGPIEMRQIVGVAARRLEFWPRPGQAVAAGERVGIMKFGSRIDLLFPAGTEIVVETGARVVAGQTVIAKLPVERAQGRGQAT